MPAVVKMPAQTAIVREETFAPILYVLPYSDFDEAIEAVRTNVDGGINVIDAALDCNVQRILALSTDKAVNPASVMGATKRVGELMVLVFFGFVATAGSAYVQLERVPARGAGSSAKRGP